MSIKTGDRLLQRTTRRCRADPSEDSQSIVLTGLADGTIRPYPAADLDQDLADILILSTAGGDIITRQKVRGTASTGSDGRGQGHGKRGGVLPG